MARIQIFGALDRVVQQLQIHVEPDRKDVAALFTAQKVARAAHFQILEGDLESAAELGVIADDL